VPDERDLWIVRRTLRRGTTKFLVDRLVSGFVVAAALPVVAAGASLAPLPPFRNTITAGLVVIVPVYPRSYRVVISAPEE
jgi:hypothetical protein